MHMIIIIPRTVEQKMISKKSEKNVVFDRNDNLTWQNSLNRLYLCPKILQKVFFKCTIEREVR